MATLTSTIAKVKSLGPGNPIHVYKGDCDLALVAINTTQMAEQDISVPGVKTTDILLSATVCETGFKLAIANAYIKADGVISLVLANPDDATVDPAADTTFQFVVAAG